MERFIAWLLAVNPCLIYLAFAVSYFTRGSERRAHVDHLLSQDFVRTFYAKTYRVAADQAKETAHRMLPRAGDHVLPLTLCAIATLPVSIAAAIGCKLPLGLPQSIANVAEQVPQAMLA